MSLLLEARGLVGGYGEMTILHGCDITVAHGGNSVIIEIGRAHV